MAQDMRLRVPRAHVEEFLRFLRMPSQERSQLLKAVSEAPSCLTPDELISEVASKLGKEEREVSGPIIVVMGLYSTRLAMEAEATEFVSAVKEEAESRATQEQAESIDWASLEEDLSRVAEMHQPLGVTAKAADLQIEHDRVFLSARVLTDIRTVFAPDPAETPAASLVIHNLRVSYIQEGKRRACYYALDSGDIARLRRELERAEKKENTLHGLLEAAHVCWLGGTEDD